MGIRGCARAFWDIPDISLTLYYGHVYEPSFRASGFGFELTVYKGVCSSLLGYPGHIFNIYYGHVYEPSFRAFGFGFELTVYKGVCPSLLGYPGHIFNTILWSC